MKRKSFFEAESQESAAIEAVFVLKDGEPVELDIVDDSDGEEDHDNVDYD